MENQADAGRRQNGWDQARSQEFHFGKQNGQMCLVQNFYLQNYH